MTPNIYNINYDPAHFILQNRMLQLQHPQARPIEPHVHPAYYSAMQGSHAPHVHSARNFQVRNYVFLPPPLSGRPMPSHVHPAYHPTMARPPVSIDLQTAPAPYLPPVEDGQERNDGMSQLLPATIPQTPPPSQKKVSSQFNQQRPESIFDKEELLKSVDLVEFGKEGRHAAKANRLIEKEEILCILGEGNVSDYIDLGEEGEIDLTKEGLDLPISSVFTPTMKEEEANVRLEKDEEHGTFLIACKQIEPHEPLRVLVSPEEYQKWAEKLLDERHSRAIPDARFNIANASPEKRESLSQVVQMDEIHVPPNRREEWASLVESLKQTNKTFFKKGPGTKEVDYIINRLVLKEIFDALNPQSPSAFPEYVKIKEIGGAFGCGGIAARPIKIKSLFAHYSGVLQKYDDCVEKDGYKFDINESTPLLNDWCITAMNHGNESRFFNQGMPIDRCNAQTKMIFFGDRPYIIFQAKKMIREGDEILFDYGKVYWNEQNIDPAHNLQRRARIKLVSNPSQSPEVEGEGRATKRKKSHEDDGRTEKKKQKQPPKLVAKGDSEDPKGQAKPETDLDRRPKRTLKPSQKLLDE